LCLSESEVPTAILGRFRPICFGAAGGRNRRSCHAPPRPRLPTWQDGATVLGQGPKFCRTSPRPDRRAIESAHIIDGSEIRQCEKIIHPHLALRHAGFSAKTNVPPHHLSWCLARSAALGISRSHTNLKRPMPIRREIRRYSRLYEQKILYLLLFSMIGVTKTLSLKTGAQ
jgi:hypothetical protein